MKPTLVYIAGKFRGPTPWDVEQNIRRAEDLGFLVASHGVVPVIPHTMFRFFDKTQTDEFWLHGTMEILRRCDALVLCTNWQESAGSRAEHAEAVRLGMPIAFAYEVPIARDYVSHATIVRLIREGLEKVYKDEDTEARPVGCQCHWEAGDSPCRVHGEGEDSEAVVKECFTTRKGRT